MPNVDSTRCSVAGLEIAVARGARRCHKRMARLPPARSSLTERAPCAGDEDIEIVAGSGRSGLADRTRSRVLTSSLRARLRVARGWEPARLPLVA
jgi:hypothetical protein